MIDSTARPFKGDDFREGHDKIWGDAGMAFIDGQDKQGRRWGRCQAWADYRLYTEQPDDATARNTEAWRAWCAEQGAKIKSEDP